MSIKLSNKEHTIIKPKKKLGSYLHQVVKRV